MTTAPDADRPALPGWRKLALRASLGLVGGVAVAVLAGWALGVHPREVLRSLEGVPAWSVLFCVLSSYGVLGFQALRWHRVMGPRLGLSYADALQAQVVGFFFNAFLPARGGDLLRVQYLGRRTGKSRATILGTELVDRWLDWWGWIPTFIVMALLSDPPRWLFKALGIFGALLVAWGLAMVVLTRSGRLGREDTRFGRAMTALRSGVQSFREPRIWVTALVIAPLPWVWEATAITIAGRAFGLHLSLVQSFSVMIAFNLAMIVPTPGGVGSQESGGTAALAFFGFDHSRSLAFLFVYHFTQLLPGMATGAALLLAQGEVLFGRGPSDTVTPPPAPEP